MPSAVRSRRPFPRMRGGKRKLGVRGRPAGRQEGRPGPSGWRGTPAATRVNSAARVSAIFVPGLRHGPPSRPSASSGRAPPTPARRPPAAARHRRRLADPRPGPPRRAPQALRRPGPPAYPVSARAWLSAGPVRHRRERCLSRPTCCPASIRRWRQSRHAPPTRACWPGPNAGRVRVHSAWAAASGKFSEPGASLAHDDLGGACPEKRTPPKPHPPGACGSGRADGCGRTALAACTDLLLCWPDGQRMPRGSAHHVT